MTCKRKILFVAAFIALGFLVFAFWLKRDEGALAITYTGAGKFDPMLPSFTITNHSGKSLICLYYMEEYPFRVRTNANPMMWPSPGIFSAPFGISLTPHGSTNYQVAFHPADRWRPFMLVHAEPAPFTFRFRLKLERWAYERRFQRFSAWVHPEDRWETIYGSAMLGNKPAPPERK